MSDYVSGGYYVVRDIPRPPDLSDLLPERLLTISNCFTTVMSDVVQLQWDDYDDVEEAIAEEAIEFGIERSQIPALVRWAKSQQNTNYHVFCHVEPLLELFHRFIREPSAHLVGIGLHSSQIESFASQLTKDVNKGLGLVELVNENRPLASGGARLGFEPLGFDATKFHSWLCHYAPDGAYKQFGIRPNQFGLIEDLDNAVRVRDWLLQTGAEPAIWEPSLLLEYASKRSSK
jgi:hypothetical protein